MQKAALSPCNTNAFAMQNGHYYYVIWALSQPNINAFAERNI